MQDGDVKLKFVNNFKAIENTICADGRETKIRLNVLNVSDNEAV
jgi:hypothetical protein